MEFNEMLDNVYSQIDINEEETFIVATPKIDTSTTNTYFKNIKKILKQINRPPDHFLSFINKNIGETNWMTSHKKDGLVIIGKIPKNKVISSVEKYINNYVICKFCSSRATKLKKITELRCYQISCKKCLSNYNV